MTLTDAHCSSGQGIPLLASASKGNGISLGVMIMGAGLVFQAELFCEWVALGLPQFSWKFEELGGQVVTIFTLEILE